VQRDHPPSDEHLDPFASVTGAAARPLERESELTKRLSTPIHRSSRSRRLAFQRQTFAVVHPRNQVDGTFPRRHGVEDSVTRVPRDVTRLTWQVATL